MENEVSSLNDMFLKLSKKMAIENELSLKEIYQLCPEINKNTISWRLHSLVQEGELYKTGHGFYSLKKNMDNKPIGYEYLQKKSKLMYDVLSGYGYKFYISGLDSLVGEIPHLPERFTTLIVIEKTEREEIKGIFTDNDFFVVDESERILINDENVNHRIEGILFNGRNYDLAFKNVALKEKGFVDLYYAVTRLNYGLSVPELFRIYKRLQSENRISNSMLLKAARDRKILTEIKWLIEINKASTKTLEFISYRMKEGQWN